MAQPPGDGDRQVQPDWLCVQVLAIAASSLTVAPAADSADKASVRARSASTPRAISPRRSEFSGLDFALTLGFEHLGDLPSAHMERREDALPLEVRA